MISRRRFIELGAAAVGGGLLASCGGAGTEPIVNNRFTARPGTPTIVPAKGVNALGLGSGRDGVMYVPAGYDGSKAVPLMILLHGAGGSGPVSWTDFYARADAHGIVLLAPSSRSTTWDIILGDVGPDIKFIDSALAYVFARCRIDTTKICLAGFSDGAGYAIAVGQANGDLLTHMAAYSPGFYAEPENPVGKPKAFVSHGTGDQVLSYSQSANNVVPELLKRGYSVTFKAFDGGHEIPNDIAEASLDWFLSA